ncbi:hypothetical protein B0T16DRAFT_451826 [Cercophora newfieldiana]|uniref:Uncharacterized protein n=1 Tax=Cercophora newfieldiana TaxID=92897 RepID=A0AA40CYL2_9PEZI|nr:hypothetical protein B0T16DRAFT_451826 [Cercophora newfieldiana]
MATTTMMRMDDLVKRWNLALRKTRQMFEQTARRGDIKDTAHQKGEGLFVSKSVQEPTPRRFLGSQVGKEQTTVSVKQEPTIKQAPAERCPWSWAKAPSLPAPAPDQKPSEVISEQREDEAKALSSQVSLRKLTCIPNIYQQKNGRRRPSGIKPS